jgi:hypothetical protein
LGDLLVRRADWKKRIVIDTGGATITMETTATNIFWEKLSSDPSV